MKEKFIVRTNRRKNSLPEEPMLDMDVLKAAMLLRCPSSRRAARAAFFAVARVCAQVYGNVVGSVDDEK